MSDNASAQTLAKRSAAMRALEWIKPGMHLGLGSGSTAEIFVELLGERARASDLRPICVCSSERTGELAQQVGLNVASLDEVGELDLAVDGTDEFDDNLALIKGGGGALLREKIVAHASKKFIVIADNSKKVSRLGAFPLPVDVVPFSWRTTMATIEQGLSRQSVAATSGRLRMNNGKPAVTDDGNYIVDFALKKIEEPGAVTHFLNTVPGVVDNGLFVDMADMAIVGSADGSSTLIERKR